jgi:hypothetical protein
MNHDQLITKNGALGALTILGGNYQALDKLVDQYYGEYNGEVFWNYPISDTVNSGQFILPVQEGYLAIPYETIDPTEHEILRLDRAYLLDVDTAKFLSEEWDIYADQLSDKLHTIIDELYYI